MNYFSFSVWTKTWGTSPSPHPNGSSSSPDPESPSAAPAPEPGAVANVLPSSSAAGSGAGSSAGSTSGWATGAGNPSTDGLVTSPPTTGCSSSSGPTTSKKLKISHLFYLHSSTNSNAFLASSIYSLACVKIAISSSIVYHPFSIKSNHDL